MQRTSLSTTDYNLIRELRREDVGVLEDAQPDLLTSKRLIIVACGDGHRLPDLLSHKQHLCNDAECLHLVAVNGGALAIPHSSPLANRGAIPHDQTTLANIQEGCHFKETNQIMPYVHFPCSAASSVNLSVVDCLNLLADAKNRIREVIPGAEMITWVHVDYNGHRSEKQFCTYRFNRKNFEKWIAKRSPNAIQLTQAA